MTKRKKTLRFPNRARQGTDNPSFKHGGHVVDLLTDEEATQYERDLKMYLDAYPYLKEPIMMDMIKEYVLMKIRLQRMNSWLFSAHIPESEKYGASRLADNLRRTMSLYATRMGITFVSRQRRKEKIKRKKPLEILEEEE